MGTSYRVGVHYFDDWGYGWTEATVRIYLHGQLRWLGKADLVAGDLWEVATITWPDTTVTSIQPAPHIIPDFPADLSPWGL